MTSILDEIISFFRLVAVFLLHVSPSSNPEIQNVSLGDCLIALSESFELHCNQTIPTSATVHREIKKGICLSQDSLEPSNNKQVRVLKSLIYKRIRGEARHNTNEADAVSIRSNLI